MFHLSQSHILYYCAAVTIIFILSFLSCAEKPFLIFLIDWVCFVW